MTGAARPVCSFEWQGYPHPGCAEFGPPDSWSCERPATHRFTWPDAAYGPETALVCDAHVDDAVGGGAYDVAELDEEWMANYDAGVRRAEAMVTSQMTAQDAMAWMHATPAEDPFPSHLPDNEAFTFGWNAEIGRKACELHEAWETQS